MNKYFEFVLVCNVLKFLNKNCDLTLRITFDFGFLENELFVFVLNRQGFCYVALKTSNFSTKKAKFPVYECLKNIF